MSIGLVNDSDFFAELESYKNLEVRHEQIARGRGHVNEVPTSLRNIIAEEKVNGTPANHIAEIFDVSNSSVSAYGHGSTSTASYNNQEPDLLNFIQQKNSEISKRARNQLIRAIEHITEDKLKTSKALDLSNVAKSMSLVIKNIEEKHDEGAKQNLQVVIFAPRQKSEDDYDVIDVSAIESAAK